MAKNKTSKSIALTARQKRFADEFLLDLNGTQAAIRAGYSPKTADQQASRLLTNVKISDRIAAGKKKRSEQTGIDAGWLLKYLAGQVGADVSALYKEDGITLKNIHDWPKPFRMGLVSDFHTVIDKDGEKRMSIKLAPRSQVVKLLGDHVDVAAFMRSVDVNVNLQMRNAKKEDLLKEVLELADISC